MIYKLISKVRDETFAAIVGTEAEDQFILNTGQLELLNPKSAEENKNKEGKLARERTTAIGFSSIEVEEIFDHWKAVSPYAFIKSNFELHDYAYQTSEEFKANNVRPFEGMQLLRRMMIRPLLVVNLKTHPTAIKNILEQNNDLIAQMNSQPLKTTKGLIQPPDQDTKV